MIPRLFQMIKFQIELVAIATCIILKFYYLEEVWSLKITPKCYCFPFSDLITKRRNSHSIPNPQKVKVSIKFWKLQTIFKIDSKPLNPRKRFWMVLNYLHPRSVGHFVAYTLLFENKFRTCNWLGS